MAIQPRIGQASADAASGNVSITHNLILQEGDVLIALINANGAGNTITDNNGSTAFTQADTVANPDTAQAAIFTRVCGTSEPATFNWTLGTSGRWSVIVLQYRGVDAGIWDVAPSGNSATGTLAATAVASSISILTTGALGLVLMADDAFPTTTTFSSVDNGYGNAVSETGQQYAVAVEKAGLATGATGATTITSSANVSYVIWQCALKPYTFEQEGFRFFNDDGSESTATGAALQDTNISLGSLVNTRLRMLLNATGNPPARRFRVEYRKNNAGHWRLVK